MGFTVPVAYRSLPGLRGVGITDGRVTRILSGHQLGIGRTATTMILGGLLSLGTAGAGAYIGSRESRGWAAGGAVLGLIAGNIISGVATTIVASTEARRIA
jgi:hypothetical protein